MNLNRCTALAFAAAAFVSAGVQAQDSSTQFTAQDGTIVTVHSGQPAPASYGAPPSFAQLDTNHDGSISRQEAEGYIPLLNDYDYLSPHSDKISRKQYETWVSTHGH